jgi:phage repressor protein C with HTH and peptisase S24 domain
MARPSPTSQAAQEIFRRLEQLGVKQQDLADALGIDANKVSKTKTGVRDFTADETLAALEWLAKQEASRRTPPNSGEAPDIPPTVSASAEDMVEIIQLDLSFSMGPGTNIDDYIEETPVRFDLGFIRQITRTPPARLRLARGIGDSMFPTLLTSDRVMIDTTQRMLNLADRVYAISLFGAAAIKRLRTVGPNRVLVISDNPAVENQEVDADDLIIAGRVVWFSRDL